MRSRIVTLPGVAALVTFTLAGAPALARQADPNGVSDSGAWTGEVELGYRTNNVDGSEDLYDSHTNLDPGTRLMGLRVHGLPAGDASRYMDTFSLDAHGLGGDPLQYIRISSGKRGVYRWNISGLRQAYVFKVPTFAAGLPPGNLGQHTNNQTDKSLSADLSLTPGRVTINVGYARREFEGPGLTTQDFSRDEFLLAGLANRKSDDYRAEVLFPAGRWSLSFEQMYRNFNSRSSYDLGPGEFSGNNATNNATLTSFFRNVPLGGSTWVSRLSASATFAERLDLSARVLHSDGDTDFTSLQHAVGVAYTGAAIDEQIGGRGGSDKPTNLAELGLTLRLTDHWEVSTLTRDMGYKIEGTTRESTVTNAGAPVVTVEDRRLDLDSFEQRTEAAWRSGRLWVLRAGNRYYSRDVSLDENGSREDSSTTTVTWYGSAGLRLGSKWRSFIEYQDGQQENLFTRIEPSDFRLARLRAQWAPVSSTDVSASVGYRKSENPNPDNENDVKSWVYSLSGSYLAKRWHVSAGANRTDLSSDTTIFFFASGARVRGSSVYELVADTYFVESGVQLGERVKGALRYQLMDATGSFPVDYVTMEPKVSVKVYDNLWLNGAFYKFKYQEDDNPAQDYDATGYIWSATYTF